MANIRIAFAAALMLCVFIPMSAAQAGTYQCKHSLDQYTEVLKVLEAEAAQARAKADQNPLYIADVGYYDSVLRDARQCMKSLTPLTTAAR